MEIWVGFLICLVRWKGKQYWVGLVIANAFFIENQLYENLCTFLFWGLSFIMELRNLVMVNFPQMHDLVGFGCS